MSSFNSLNKVMLLGRLGRDPETKYSQGSGTAITNFSLATSERYKKGDNWEERTEWHRIVVFGNQAESASKFLRKGSLVFLEGRLQTRNYQDRDGNEKYITEIVANQVKFLDSKDSGGDNSYKQRSYQDNNQDNNKKNNQQNNSPAPQNNNSSYNSSVSDALADDFDDDDLPF